MIKLLKEKMESAEFQFKSIDMHSSTAALAQSYYEWGRLQAFKEALKLIEG